MAKLVLDLHDIYNRGDQIDRALREVIDEAVEKKIDLVEIIPGKGSGQLKKKVLRFLDQKEIKALYHRVDKDSKNFGRLFVHFRHGNSKHDRGTGKRRKRLVASRPCSRHRMPQATERHVRRDDGRRPIRDRRTVHPLHAPARRTGRPRSHHRR